MPGTLYEQLGGQPAVDALSAKLYGKILADPLLAGFFTGTDMEKQVRRMAAFLTRATGSPGHYHGRSLREAHAGLNITDAHFDAVAGHLAASLRELGAGEAGVSAAVALAESTRGDVVGQPAPAPGRRFSWRRLAHR